MSKLTAVLLGAGGRGKFAYGPYAKKYPHELEFVAVAEPEEQRRESFAQEHRIPRSNIFTSWEDVFLQERLADIIVICTQDRMHFEPTMKALKAGYHVLLEKPMSPLPEECLLMEEASRKHDRLLTICHVLRHTPFWSAIKQIVSAGDIGDIVSLQLNENVGYFHIAHSFVRGQWRRAEETSPMILQKSCHDMDIISWLIDKPCLRISSFGSLQHFRIENAPPGSPGRCTDGCAAEKDCPYSAYKIYMQKDSYPWARFITSDLSQEGIYKALQEGPFGRCVYRCDNNVVDHQVVNMEFAGGTTAAFTMSGFTYDCARSVQIMGTRGEIRGYMEDNKISVYKFGSATQTDIRITDAEGGHGGGDERLMQSFLKQVRNNSEGQSLTSAQASVQSHLMAFAAEQSRIAQGSPVDIAEFGKTVLGLKSNITPSKSNDVHV